MCCLFLPEPAASAPIPRSPDDIPRVLMRELPLLALLRRLRGRKWQLALVAAPSQAMGTEGCHFWPPRGASGARSGNSPIYSVEQDRGEGRQHRVGLLDRREVARIREHSLGEVREEPPQRIRIASRRRTRPGRPAPTAPGQRMPRQRSRS